MQYGYTDASDEIAKKQYIQAQKQYDIQTKYNNMTGTAGSNVSPVTNTSNYTGQDLYSQYNQNINETRKKTNQIFDMIGADNQNITNKNNQYWDTLNSDKSDMGNRYSKLEDLNYSNAFTTDEARSILERYDLAGLQGRDNEVAAGGANNGGNIDSYSGANALRQQASLRNLGEQTALAAHSRRINDGLGILDDRGAYLQGIYNRPGRLIPKQTLTQKEIKSCFI